nr:hypothetical protein [Tanacetum cinerariifolium]
MAEKWAKLLCFYCDQRYSPGHKCSGRMYSLELIGCDELVEDEVEEINDPKPVNEEEPMPQVSLNAMTGVTNYHTMRVKGHVKKQLLHISVDCKSTYNFLGVRAAKRLGCKISNICPLQVSVANGQVMSCVYECKNFKWSIQGQTFETYVMILPLGGCEMVLGIQCKSERDHLDHLRTVLQTMKQHTLFAKQSKCNFGTTQVEYLGHIITTEGVSNDPTKIQSMEHKPLTNLLKKDAFEWSDEASRAFLALKQVMTQISVLALPDFQKTFVVETDASREGSENIVAGAFLRLNNGSELNALVLSTVTSDLMQRTKDNYKLDTHLEKVIQQLTKGTYGSNKYVWEGGVLRRKRKLVMGADELLRTIIVQHYHADVVGGHSGIVADLAAYPRLLQPLPVPEKILSEISMDFITGFLWLILLLFGQEMVNILVSGKEYVFNHLDMLNALFQRKVFTYAKQVKPYILMVDFITFDLEIVNILVSGEEYDKVFNHLDMLNAPFQGKVFTCAKQVKPYVERSLQAKESAIGMLKFHIKRARDRMKKYADLKRSEMEFDVGIATQWKSSAPSLSCVPTQMGLLPHCGEDGLLSVEPCSKVILDRRIGKLNNRAAVYVLVKWVSQDAT